MGMDYPTANDSNIWRSKDFGGAFDSAINSKNYILASLDTLRHYICGHYGKFAGSRHHIRPMYAGGGALDARNARCRLLGPSDSGTL